MPTLQCQPSKRLEHGSTLPLASLMLALCPKVCIQPDRDIFRGRFKNLFIHQTVEHHPRGYPRLAALQNSDPVFSIFRRFGNLHARCLLLAQDELSTLEAQLTELDTGERVQLFLSSRAHDGNERRRAVLNKIRSKLREFRKFRAFSVFLSEGGFT